VGWLLEQIRANGESKEVRDEVIELGTRYGLVTPYTSYLATDGNEREEFVENFWRRRDANAPTPKSAPVMKEKSGAGAVKLSVQQNTMQQNTQVAVDEKADREQIILRNTRQNQFIANKNFINHNNVWIDAEFAEGSKMQEVSVKFASDEYFELLKRAPELAPYLSLGEQVVVVWKDKLYRITK
jgi:Ca-activated chloride channel family protein